MLLALAGAASGQTSEQVYRSALDAARAGDYPVAIAGFEQAKAAGLTHSRLFYNLAVSHYQLGNLHAARQAFLRASRDPDLAALSHYNLGLLARARGERSRTLYHFSLARDYAQTEELRRLAAEALAAVPARQPLLEWELAGGYDRSFEVYDAVESVRQRRGAGFYSLWGYADHTMPLGDAHEYTVYLTATALDYPAAAEADFTYVDMGAELVLPHAAWDHVLSLAAYHSAFGGDTLERALVLSAATSRDLDSRRRLRAEYSLSAIDGGSRYRYFDGLSHRLRLGLDSLSTPALSWGGNYDLLYNDRRDLADEYGVASVSPVRHGVGAYIRYRIRERIVLDFGSEARFSRYRDRHRMVDGFSRRREDVFWRVNAEIDYRLLPGGWRSFLRLEWVENDSSLEQYRYGGPQVSAGIGWRFP
ncbi:hypothetical protein CAL65_15120 [Alkalilimnicola ehrlichii]|uniref:Uncharacterized protein n=1 Tax=Alkalilimnicola ehrlichii TaxID=351052 RepID=A0A3E0WN35_9GAMM|nr:hypothetical protein CAL65_15120 [Alkalilimnicola ehrlichii]